MKQKLFKSLKVVAVLMIALFTVLAIGEATGYVKTLTRTQTPTGWVFLRGSHTFVAATDTAYFLFTPAQAKAISQDTSRAMISCQIRPASDSSNIAWEVWSTSDTSGTWLGRTAPSARSGLWNITAIGRDSVASGYVSRNFNVGHRQFANQPYVMVVAIGKAALSNGKANEIGNVAEVNIIQQ